MKSLAWIVGLSSVVAFSAWACGDEVEEVPTTASTSTTGSGGSGASGTSSTSTQMVSSSTGAPMCNMGDICEQACCHVEEECGIPNGCDLAMQFLGIDLTDCTNETSECLAECVAPADCAAIGSLIGSTPDPELQGCLAMCAPPGCNQCVVNACYDEIMACQGVCQDFITCVQTQMCQDEACFLGCAAAHPSPETDALVACAQANCPGECLGGGGGAGGGAGTGGAGGN